MDSTELLNLIKSRRSIRAFKPDPIPDDVLNIILEAGRWSQSANNRQPWRFVVIRKREIIQKLAKLAPYGKFINEAPILLAIIADKKIAPKWYLHDTCILTCQICLMAWSLGIGTCWIGAMDRNRAGDLIGLAKNEFLTTILPLGYPKRIPAPTHRKKLEKLVTYI